MVDLNPGQPDSSSLWSPHLSTQFSALSPASLAPLNLMEVSVAAMNYFLPQTVRLRKMLTSHSGESLPDWSGWHGFLKVVQVDL